MKVTLPKPDRAYRMIRDTGVPCVATVLPMASRVYSTHCLCFLGPVVFVCVSEVEGKSKAPSA